MSAKFESQEAYRNWCEHFINRLHTATITENNTEIRELLMELRRQLHISEGDTLINSESSSKDILISELKDFAIWMTGCGYDFTQHPYFCEQRDKLLKT